MVGHRGIPRPISEKKNYFHEKEIKVLREVAMWNIIPMYIKCNFCTCILSNTQNLQLHEVVAHFPEIIQLINII